MGSIPIRGTMFKRADELREGDKVRVFDWASESVVTDIESPFKPHVRVATRTIHFPGRECVRIQLDYLSWILWDVDFEVEVYD